MKTYMIGYDLNKTGQDYASLIQETKEIANGYGIISTAPGW